MPYYDLSHLIGDIAQIRHEYAGFGTGRLVANNLILTTAHTLWAENDSGPFLIGWQVRLERDWDPTGWPYRCKNRVVWHDRARDLALIKLVNPKGGPLSPVLRLRIATALATNQHKIEARGYPRASKRVERRDLTPVHGHLTATERDRPLDFGVDLSDLPNNRKRSDRRTGVRY